jgi:hypothetical protein
MLSKNLCPHFNDRILVIGLPEPKASFRLRLSETEFLNVSIFPTRKDPTAEVISVQVNRMPRAPEDDWETVGKIAIYRSPEGNYSQLPDREKPSK